MDHTYHIRLPKLFRDGSDHSYALLNRTLKQTPTSKRKRKSSSPPGRTQVQISKRRSVCDDSGISAAKHCFWSIEEKKYLHQYVSSNVKQDTESDTMYWKKCAEAVNVKFPEKQRTGRSCKNAHKRLDFCEEIPVT